MRTRENKVQAKSLHVVQSLYVIQSLLSTLDSVLCEKNTRDEYNDFSLQAASSLVGRGTPFHKYKLSLRPPGPLRMFGTVWPASWIHSTKSTPALGDGGGDVSGSPVENLMPSCVVILV